MSYKRETAVDVLDGGMQMQGWAPLTARQCQRAIDLLESADVEQALELLSVLRDTAARYEQRQKEQFEHYLSVKNQERAGD